MPFRFDPIIHKGPAIEQVFCVSKPIRPSPSLTGPTNFIASRMALSVIYF
jgi:hypothetical protein